MGKLGKVDGNAELYAFTGQEVFLLAIRHHKQLSFDFKALW